MGISQSIQKTNLTMHIAVCDDNMGDRKQLERLLGRESDARAKDTGVFYIDSYGNAQAAMASPMLYDAFFIDMTSGDTDGTLLTKRLLETGVTSPVILCVSTINYRKTLEADTDKRYSNIFYLDKPLKKAELSEMLDKCISLKAQKVSTIELRGEKETRYVTEDDIVSARLDGNYVLVSLKDGSTLKIISTLENFYSQLASFSHYASLTAKSMINVAYVQKVSLFQVTMTDGTVLRTTPSFSHNIKKALRQYTEEP